jgi:diguanylate cyclase (GGDEF)-like protein
LPLHFSDRAGRLMEGTQYTLTAAARDDHAPGARAPTPTTSPASTTARGEKRLSEEVARAERDLQTFHIAFFDVNGFKQINEKHGHSAATRWSRTWRRCCSSTRAAATGSRAGAATNSSSGLHRNRALKMVMERIVKAISGQPLRDRPGPGAAMTVSCGVADYRFGSGRPACSADGDRAMYAAKELSRAAGQSNIAYRNEISEVAPPERSVEAAD